MAWNKEQDLKIKYAYIPEDAANEPNKKKKKPSPKKAKHKHDYAQSVIIEYYDKYCGKCAHSFINVCTTCGRIGDFKDVEGIISKKFPHVMPGWFGFQVDLGHQYELEEFNEWARKYYPVIVWKDFNTLSDKFIADEFLDELGIGTDK